MTVQHRRIKKNLIMLIAFIMLAASSLDTAYAGYSGWGAIYHIGNYYFKYDHGGDRLYVSKKKNSGYHKTPVDNSAFVSNGKEVMYASLSGERYYLKSYDIKRKKVKAVRKLPKGSWEASGAAGQYIWLDGEKGIYRYDVDRKKLKLVKKNASLYHLQGKHHLCFYGKEKTIKVKDEFGSTTIYGSKAAIYETTKKGKLKVVKKLGYVYEVNEEIYYVWNYGKIKKFYYSTNGGHDLYRIYSNGKGKKKIASFKGVIPSLYDKYCYIIENEKYYKYVYKTGKKTQTSNYY